MSPSVATFSGPSINIDCSADGRPVKRPRKDHQPATHSEGMHQEVPLSCCECRRLKLRCDRTFPCGSCKKRGVSDICPDGVLVSGKGTRFKR
ncbi:uncharacterized protein C8R40DRAFT_616952 [Lentinula edodes]|uniref:uncharacterized protein n=1 Tax=Lentinula edodes TaxID=5353 RepID=UPI001E8D92D5|nr:uncharacterized protein C8R40DRAFT_616952 [Lentinula edodes]KAH7870937.1 hypothetical protein C8R40DRAFT_616952 [Lentinula edodes]